jgi:5-methylcytosine-specific restriction endonuclease McrA
MSQSTKKRNEGLGNLGKKVLVLNKAYTPINVITVRRSLELWFNGRCEIIQEYENIDLHSGFNPKTGIQVVIKAPCIIHMYRSRVSHQAMVKTVPFSRHLLFQRDEGRCVYCGKELPFNNWTIDHVFPESKGGLTDWYNCRVCCSLCNSNKGSSTLEELGWEYPKKVGIPTLSKKVPKNIVTSIGGRIPHESWRPYIYWELNLNGTRT